jgi:hypothetical protein
MRLRMAEALIPTVRTPLVDFPGHDQVAVAQHVRDLARRSVRDRIDREYAQPLYVDAARPRHAHVGDRTDQESRSAGHGAAPSVTAMNINRVIVIHDYKRS